MSFKTHEECLAYLEQVRWNGQPKCPYCGSIRASAYKNEHRYHCNDCFTSYSVTVGTLFHKTHIDLHIWFRAIQIVLIDSREVSIRKLAGKLKISKKTASYMRSRINRAIQDESELMQELSQLDLSEE
jgi:transposase-like protein